MRKQIMDALATKFQGVSETILGRVADKLARNATNAEDAKAAVDGFTFQQLLESYGDSRANEAQQTAVQNYEKKYGLKEGKKADGGKPVIEPEEKPDKDKGGDDLAKAISAAVAAAMKPLQDEIANFKQGRVTETRKQQLSKVIGRLPESLRKGYERTSVDNITEEQFSTLLGEITEEVDGIIKENGARGAVLGVPFGNGGKGAPSGTGATKEATAEEADAVVGKLNV